jgi:eukaryotic-like serine/threonine-protein kinase
MLTYKGHTGEVQALAWSPDSRYLASGSWDGTVQVWNATTGRRRLAFQSHADDVASLAWSPDGERIASAAGNVLVWQAA